MQTRLLLLCLLLLCSSLSRSFQLKKATSRYPRAAAVSLDSSGPAVHVGSKVEKLPLPLFSIEGNYQILSILSAASVVVHPKTLSGIVGPLMLANTLDLLRSAARRNRLDGGTFKWLNLGVFLFFASSLVKQGVKLSGSTISGSVLGRVGLFLYGTSVMLASIVKHGIPILKMDFLNILSVVYFVSSDFYFLKLKKGK